jgi:decaprenylphospho-beta-D-ribofuranose 2-oxidase
MHQKPDRFRTLEDKSIISQISRGAGLSYVPASFGKNILVKEMLFFNRILEFDESSKIVVVESGITLKKLLEWSFKKQLFFPVLPGWPEITVGGCLAANVHGKNPCKDGIFMDHVEWIELFNPIFGTKIISRFNESKVFEATCGGLGLTGIITKVALRLQTLPSDSLSIIPKKAETLADALNIMKQNTDLDVLYSWHIGSTFLNFGKGIVRLGTFSKKFDSDDLVIPKIKNMSSDNKLLPFSLWNNFSSSIINSINRKLEFSKGEIKKTIFSGLFPFVDRANIFYTLYGSKGFNEYQLLISDNHANEFLDDLIKLIKLENPPLTFLFIKLFKNSQKYLRFSGNGVSIILNLKHCSATLTFLKKLDDLVISYNALPYIIKDSRLSKRVVEQCYSEYYDFKEILKEIDPKRIFKSELSERLDL